MIEKVENHKLNFFHVFGKEIVCRKLDTVLYCSTDENRDIDLFFFFIAAAVIVVMLQPTATPKLIPAQCVNGGRTYTLGANQNV